MSIYSCLQESQAPQTSLEQFLRERGGETVSRTYGFKVANKSLQLSAEDVAPWKRNRKPKIRKDTFKWGPPRSVTADLRSKKKTWRFNFEKLQSLRSLWLEKAIDNFPSRPSSDYLSTVELVGAQAKIVSASCVSLVGKEGTIVRETANTIDFVGEDNCLKTVPKRKTVFTVFVNNQLWTFDGCQMIKRRS